MKRLCLLALLVLGMTVGGIASAGAAVLWDQPLSAANTNAYVDQDFPDFPGNSTYLVDDFTLATGSRVTAIYSPGSSWNGATGLGNASSLTWSIYADDAGLPAGYPGSATGPVWTLTLAPADAQVTLSASASGFNDNALLTLASPVILPAGTYWLFFYPTMSFTPYGQYGRQVADTVNGGTAKAINPGGAFGYGTTWFEGSVFGFTQHDLAFRIEGVTFPELGLTATVNQPELSAGQYANLLLTAVNGGTNDSGVRVVTDIPPNLVPVSNTCGATWNVPTASLIWNIGELAYGASASCTILLQATGTCGTSTIEAAVYGTNPDSAPGNETASVAIRTITNQVADPGLEAGHPNPYWAETWLAYPAIWNGPSHSGSWAMWFGGSGVEELATVEQNVTIPADATALTFWHMINARSGNGTDYMRVLIDGVEIYRVLENSTTYDTTWRQVQLSIAPFADGASHLVRFEGYMAGPADSNFFVDDVAIETCGGAKQVFAELFTDGTAAGDKNWKVASGAFTVNRTKNYVSARNVVNRSLVKVSKTSTNLLGLATGRIEARLKLTNTRALPANAALIFARKGTTAYRYVQIKKGKLLIGQVGSFGGETPGVKASVSRPFAVGPWYNLWVDLNPDGMVRVYRNLTLLAQYKFPTAETGAVGVGADKASSLFDNFKILDKPAFPSPFFSAPPAPAGRDAATCPHTVDPAAKKCRKAPASTRGLSAPTISTQAR